MNANRREFIKATGIGVTGLYLGSSFSWLSAATANDASHGTLAEQITVICRRLAGHGWRALMLKVTGGELDLSSPTLAKELEKQLTKIDRTVPGFEDFAPLDEQNKFLFRVLPTRFSAYVAMQKRGDKTSFGPMRFKDGDDGDAAREFWVPLHKLFTGPECIRGLTLDLNFEAHFVNEKLRRLHTFMEQSGFGANSAPADRDKFPFVIRDAKIAGFAPTADYGTGVIAPKPNPLFEKAMFNGKPLGFKVAHDFSNADGNTWFSSLQIVPDSG